MQHLYPKKLKLDSSTRQKLRAKYRRYENDDIYITWSYWLRST